MYDYKDPCVVDFSKVTYYSEVHKILKEAFDFPDYYGENLDALWDCLTDISGEIINVEIHGLSVVRDKFDDTADELISIFREWKHYANDRHCDKTRIFIIEGRTETELT